MKTVKLGDICEFKRGLTYKKSNEAIYSKNIVLRANNIDLESFKLNFNDLKYISDSIDIPATKYVEMSTILICTASGSKSHLGKVALIDKNYGYAFGGFMGLLVPHKNLIDARYLYRVLTSREFRDLIDSLTDGTNINNLKFSLIQDFEFILPSLEEQRRVVARLDVAFEKIDTAIENTEKNLRNVQELFRSESYNIFANNQWPMCELFEHVKFIDYRGRTPKKTESGMRLITAKNIKLGYLQDEPREYVSPEIYDEWMTRGIPQNGDVLFTTEAPLANVAQLNTAEKVVFAQRCITLQPDRSIFNPSFLKHMLMTNPVRAAIFSQGTGTTVQGIKASLLKKINVFQPTIAEQDEVVVRLDKLSEQTKNLQGLYQQKLNDLQLLKQSLLREAFSTSEVE